MLHIKTKKIPINYLWLPILVGSFLFSFDLKYDLIGATFVALIAQSVAGLTFTLSRSVNLLSVYFIFTLVFFNLLPWLHYSTGHAIWRSTPILDSTYIAANIVTLLANATLFFIYIVCSKGSKKLPRVAPNARNRNLTLFILLSLSGLGFALLFYMNGFSISQLLFRGLLDEERAVVIESSSFALLLGMIARLVPVFCFYFATTQLKGGLIAKWALFLLMLVSVFPTGVARYMVAFAYIPLMLLFIPSMRRASVFSATLLFSLIFIFPFLDQFRYFSGVENLSFLPSAEFFYAAHFDAYENFASAIENSFITYGLQLLGSLLFFVPRVFWPDKPVGSGYELAEQMSYSFNNISMPFLGEGYVNFGFAGVVLFAAMIGFLMAKLDCRFSAKEGAKANPDYSSAIYYFMIGALFFLLRGDLLSSFAYMTAGLVVAFCVEKTAKLVNSFSFKI